MAGIGISSPTNLPPAVALLRECRDFEEVRQIHGQLVVTGLLSRSINSGRLVESYVNASSVEHAFSVFKTIPSPDSFAYNTLMRGLTLADLPLVSLRICDEMMKEGIEPDNHTFTFAFKACARARALSEAKQLHGLMVKSGKSPDTFVHSSMIRMYSSFGDLSSAERILSSFHGENTVAKNAMISGFSSQGRSDLAREVFDGMSKKDDASWSAMISCYVENEMYSEALKLFRSMIDSDSEAKPSESTLASCLSACARSGALETGKWIHNHIDRKFSNLSVTLGTALVDMYAKCGCIETSYEVFESMEIRDVVTWGAIISGFAIHGDSEKCFELFEKMISLGFEPNEIVFLAVISACSHGGRVDLGLRCFDRMIKEFKVSPTIKHFGSIVDLLARAGRLSEAESFISKMPMKANSVIWGSFLSACRTHNDLERGSLAFKKLTEIDPMCGDRYKLAALLFGGAGEKESSEKIRKFIAENDLETTRGISFIEINGVLREFVAGEI